jgi:hypothetical protein
MNTVHLSRRGIGARARRSGARRSAHFDRPALILLAVACAVLFLLSFLFARVLSRAGQASQETLPQIASAHAHELLPVRLTTAPAILPGVAAVPVARAKPVSRRRVTASQQPAASAVVPSSAPVVPSVPAPAVSVPVAPVAAPPVAAAPVKAPERQTKSAPAPSKGSGGGGVSFDSSG